MKGKGGDWKELGEGKRGKGNGVVNKERISERELGGK